MEPSLAHGMFNGRYADLTFEQATTRKDATRWMRWQFEGDDPPMGLISITFQRNAVAS